MRTRMISTLDNFGITAPCKLCKLDTDTINHVLNCILLKLEVPELLNNQEISTKDAFQSNIDKMKTLAGVFEKAWRKREELLEELE